MSVDQRYLRPTALALARPLRTPPAPVWVTTNNRMYAGMAQGAAVGATLTAAGFGAAWSQTDPALVMLMAFIWIPAYIVWFVGLVVVGLPHWAIFHGVGLRGWPAAAGLGAALSFCISLQLGADMGLREGGFVA